MTRNLTAQDFLRIKLCDALQSEGAQPVLSEAERYAQVVFAKTLRNFWFTSSIMGIADAVALSITPRFAQPVIITDVLSLLEFPYQYQNVAATPIDLLLEISQYGGEGNAYGRNFYDLYGPAISWLISKHERNRKQIALEVGITTAEEMLDKHIGLLPHLLRPYETLKMQYTQSDGDSARMLAALPHLGFRAVKVLAANDPYRKLSPLADKMIRDYIHSSQPETFFLEVRTPLASLGAKGEGFVDLRTPQLERPIMILGAASNVEGARLRLYDESGYYQFTYQEKPLLPFVLPGANLWRQYTDPPLSIIAPNTDFHNVDLFNMWPVPHVLEPGNSLKLRLGNGCIPDGGTGAGLKQAAATFNSQDVRVTFICRTP